MSIGVPPGIPVANDVLVPFDSDVRFTLRSNSGEPIATIIVPDPLGTILSLAEVEPLAETDVPGFYARSWEAIERTCRIEGDASRITTTAKDAVRAKIVEWQTSVGKSSGRVSN